MDHQKTVQKETQPGSILIAGAGPVGLAAGLFLKRNGASIRIVDPLLERTIQSRALAVNPRTLTLLEDTGVTAKMIERGIKVHGFSIWREDETQLVDVDFTKLSLKQGFDKYPFVLALSQSVTEMLLAEALNEQGITVQRGWRASDVELHDDDDIEVTLEDESKAGHEVLRVDHLVAADGAHSTIRKTLGLKFEGESRKEDWLLTDVPLRTNLDPHRAHLCFYDDGGFLFMLRVVEDARREPRDGALWRIMSTRPIDLNDLFKSEAAGEPIWQSSFHIAHRIASELQKKNVFLMGDAAHVHSPAGARGMNLGIEDAWVLADLHRSGQLEDYGRLRRAVDSQVVHKVDFITKIAAGDQAALTWARTHILPTLLAIPQFQGFMFKAMSGQDHAVGRNVYNL